MLSGDAELTSHPAARNRVPPSIAAIGALFALLSADVLGGSSHAAVFALGLVAFVVTMWLVRLAKSWTVLLGTIVCVVLLIPNNGSYVLPEALPFQLEPYRVVIGLLELGWVISLLIDPRVRSYTSGFEGPMLMILAVTLGSDLANPHHVAAVSSFTIKALWLFLSFVLFFYVVVSVVRTREMIERILTVFVCAGTIIAIAAIYQRRSGYNVFDHLQSLLVVFHYVAASASAEERGGYVRAFAGAGNPIELATLMAMLVPLAVYLAISRRRRIWFLSAVLMLLADFSGGSRTGIIGIGVIGLVFLWLRPRQTLRCWPALLPIFVVLHFAAPGAIGSVIGEFFPKGGIIHQQEETEIGPHGETKYASRLSRIGPVVHEYLEGDPLFGIGYGTRVTGYHNQAADNAIILDNEWLDTLLETGILGVFAWLWLFRRIVRRLSIRAKLEGDTADGWLAVALAASISAYAVAMYFYDSFGFVQATFVMFTLAAFASTVLRLPSRASEPELAGRLTRAPRPGRWLRWPQPATE